MTTEEKIEVSDISTAEADAEFGVGEYEDEGTAGDRIKSRLADGAVDGIPDWASVPPNFAIAPGRRCGWMLFRADWTDAPDKGDRWCMMWPLSESEEKLAYKRSGGDSVRAITELTKASIRLVDGVAANRTGSIGPGSVGVFWAEIGTKLRQMLQNYYLKTHSLSPEEQQDFFANCFVVTMAKGG